MIEIFWQAFYMPPRDWHLASISLILVLITILVSNGAKFEALEHMEVIDVSQHLRLIIIFLVLNDELLGLDEMLVRVIPTVSQITRIVLRLVFKIFEVVSV